MPNASEKPGCRCHTAIVPTAQETGEDWLDIDSEPALPGRAALIAWSEMHPLAVIAVAAAAFWAPVIAALCFG